MHLTWLSFFTWWYCLEIVLIKAQMHNTCSFFMSFTSANLISKAYLLLMLTPYLWIIYKLVSLSSLMLYGMIGRFAEKKYIYTNTESPPTTNINEIFELLFKNNWITGYGETKNQVRSLNWYSISSKEMAKL